jgi:hypothetical protein
MSESYIKIELNNKASLNDVFRLLRDLKASIFVENIEFEVD